MKEIILQILKKLDTLSRAIERGDIELDDFRRDLLRIYEKAKDIKE